MPDTRKSFFSSIPGLVTGLAGLLTAIVGVVTLAVQQGWVGDSGGTSPTSTTVGGSGGTGSSPSSGSSGAANLDASPTSVAFGVGKSEQRVSFTNGGDAAAKLATTKISGPDASDFTVGEDGCSGRTLRPGDDCQVSVKLASQLPGDASANLVVTPAQGSPVVVSLTKKIL